MEPVEKTAMTQPLGGRRSLVLPGLLPPAGLAGGPGGGITLLAYGLGFHLTGTFAVANTMAFATLTLCQLFHAFNVRSEDRSLFAQGALSNRP